MYLICGEVCSGKTHYARERFAENAVLLSCDELSLTLFPEGLGGNHDSMMERAHAYLLGVALKIVKAGMDVVLDWGFWRRSDREAISGYMKAHGTEYEWHYIDVSEERRKKNIEIRNSSVQDGCPGEYFADEGLLEKCRAAFETPCEDEIDVWVKVR